MTGSRCEECCYYGYDEEYQEYYCDIRMDEDEAYRLKSRNYRECPYFRRGDGYDLSRRQ